MKIMFDNIFRIVCGVGIFHVEGGNKRLSVDINAVALTKKNKVLLSYLILVRSSSRTPAPAANALAAVACR